MTHVLMSPVPAKTWVDGFHVSIFGAFVLILLFSPAGVSTFKRRRTELTAFVSCMLVGEKKIDWVVLALALALSFYYIIYHVLHLHFCFVLFLGHVVDSMFWIRYPFFILDFSSFSVGVYSSWVYSTAVHTTISRISQCPTLHTLESTYSTKSSPDTSSYCVARSKKTQHFYPGRGRCTE